MAVQVLMSRSEKKHGKFVVAVFVLQNTYKFGHFVVVLQRMAKICAKMDKASGEPLFYSINLLFSDALVAVVVCLSFLLYEIE